jgi:heptosyltransferase-3
VRVFQQPARQILFITLSNIGDAILTTPALMAVHRTYPEALIDIVGDARSIDVFLHCPFRDQLVLKYKGNSPGNLIALIRRLRQRRYDLVVDLRTDGFASLLRSKRRMTKRAARPTGPHSAQQHLAVVSSLGGEDPPATQIWLNDDLRDRAASRLQPFRDQRILAMGPGARWAPKIWPADHFVEIATRVADRFDVAVLLGSEQDRPACDAIEDQLGSSCLNLCGKMEILDAAAILELSTVFIGNDSGLGHIASAVGTPTVTVFGPGQPERYHPWGPGNLWLTSPTGEVADVPADAVEQALRQLAER